MLSDSELLEIIKKSSYDGMFITDKDGITLFITDSYKRITGYDGQQLLGQNAAKLKEFKILDTSVFEKVHQSHQPVSMILHYINNNKDILVTAIPIFNHDCEYVAMVGNIRDMTELARLKSKLAYSQKWYIGSKEEMEELKIRDILDRTFVANSRQMRTLVALALKIAKVDSTVLITGESGVGKDVYAKLLLKLSSLETVKPFIKVSCAAIPETLLESELFGYEEGAFTGARKRGKPGAFELAGKGIVFLDEIGEMPLALQVKLLTVLQDREFFPLGGTRPMKMNARVIAATNRDLIEAVQKKEFRQDLYYRLNVIPVEIPPLRERTDDIIPLTAKFGRNLNEKYNIERSFDGEVLDIFERYFWPGNVRELSNMIERLFLLAPNDLITPDQLPDHLKNIGGMPRMAGDDMKLKDFLEQMEQSMITKALERYGSFKNAAKALGIDQSTLTRKVQKYNLPKRNITKHIHQDV